MDREQRRMREAGIDPFDIGEAVAALARTFEPVPMPALAVRRVPEWVRRAQTGTLPAVDRTSGH